MKSNTRLCEHHRITRMGDGGWTASPTWLRMPIRGFGAVTGLLCSVTAQSDCGSVSGVCSDFDSPLRAEATLSMPVTSAALGSCSMRKPAPSAVHVKRATEKQTKMRDDPICAAGR